MENFGNIFSNKSDMGSKRNDTRDSKLGKISDGDNVLGDNYSYIYYNLSTFYKTFHKTTMAETAMAVAWKLFAILGFGSLSISYLTVWNVRPLDISFDQLPYPFKNLMYFMSFLFLAISSWRAYQKGRKSRIENDQMEWENLQRRKEVEDANKK